MDDTLQNENISLLSCQNDSVVSHHKHKRYSTAWYNLALYSITFSATYTVPARSRPIVLGCL